MKKPGIHLTSVIFPVLFLMMLSLWRCAKDIGTLPPPDPCDSVSYTRDIQPLVAAKCISCHNDNSKSGGYSFATYDVLKEVADNGKLHGVIIEGKPRFMPYGSQLPQDEKDLVRCWIANGARK